MSKPQMFERVALARDLPAHGLKRGDVAVLVDRVPHPAGSTEGAVIEVFNAIGDSIATIVVACDDIEPLVANEILSARLLSGPAADAQQPA
ncbi:MAG TPA: hypothetical protein VHZ24_00180 [Pirellulales bacterium]|jgi:hypothetical protein|nr:hypothetical protein [Pirellulales bacterium]